MNVNARFAEQANIVLAAAKDLSSSGIAEKFVSLKNYERATIVLVKGAGTAGDDPTITVRQAQDVSGTGAKALNFTVVDHKRHASALPGIFTTATQAAGNTYTSDTLAEELAVIAIDLHGEDLDVDNGFDCVGVSIADVGNNAQIGALMFILWGGRSGVRTAEAN